MAPNAHAVEIWNTGCAMESTRGDGTYLLDQLLDEGHRLTAYAADDAHFRFSDAFGGWMMVKAADNQPEALVDAMKAGLFYSSQGPTIEEFTLADGEARVACSAVANIALVGRGTRVAHQRGDALTSAVLPTEKFAGDWCRLVITDAAGRSAWSNPVWLDQAQSP
jgi:hypothetical protein